MFDNDIKISGKHATYLKFLSQKASELKKDAVGAGIFKRYIDVYMAAAVIGALKNRKEDAETGGEDATIFAAAVVGEQANLKFIYRLVLLTDNPALSEDERINNAFRYDTDLEKQREGMNILNAYVRGGITWLYEKFTDGATTHEDYIERISEIVEEFAKDYNLSNGGI